MIQKLFNTLKQSGVKFIYSDNIIDFSLITNIDLKDREYIKLQLEYTANHIVPLKDFKRFHYKENIDSTNWENIRKFDSELDQLAHI